MDYKLPQRIENSNKSTYGRVLNVAGSDYMPGAAYLSSASALKIGCGYCFLLTTEKVIPIVAAKLSNVVFVPGDDFEDYVKSADVISIGCGLTESETSVEEFKIIMDEIPIKTPLVVDADGLNIISRYPSLFLEHNFENVVFTPHPKEAGRLLGCGVDDVLADVESAAKKLCSKYNCITVLKTHKTVVCAPDGRIYYNNTGNNSMAKAGSGDVLTGMISGLIAQGMDLFEACALGVYLHGLSGDIAAEKLTKYSVMADDLISCIPSAIKFYTEN